MVGLQASLYMSQSRDVHYAVRCIRNINISPEKGSLKVENGLKSFTKSRISRVPRIRKAAAFYLVDGWIVEVPED